MKPASATLNPGYTLFTLAWFSAICWLSSRPDLGTTDSDPLVALASNLSHAPLFAGLAYCWVRMPAHRGRVSWRHCGLAFAGAGACAVVDEWHQSFVPGRQASVTDVLLDLAGIVSMLLILRARAARELARTADSA